jgi:uncharacterized membrane protein YdjX (TVP38/TMEM64 family)
MKRATDAVRPADETGRGPALRPGRLVPLAVIAVAAVLGFAFFGDALSFETLRDNREGLIAWRDQNLMLAGLAYMLAYVAVVAFSLPGGAVMTMAGGFLFGVLAGSAMAVVAATLGATAIFLAAKHGLGDALHARILAGKPSGRLARLEAGLRQNAFNYLLFVRLIPAFPFALVNLVPAFLGVGLQTYVAATLLGIVPGTVVYAWIGAGLGAVFERGEAPDLSILFDPVILGPILGLAALAALPVVVKALRREAA